MLKGYLHLILAEMVVLGFLAGKPRVYRTPNVKPMPRSFRKLKGLDLEFEEVV